MSTISEALDNALKHHQAGRLQQAEHGYRQILAADASNADALHLLGLVFHQVGKHDSARESIERATALKRNEPVFLTSLAAVFLSLGNHAEAVTCCQRAVQIDPDHYTAHYNLGCSFFAQQKLNEAIASHQRAVEIKPDFSDAHYNLGCAFQKHGNLEEAAASYRRALESNPDQPLWELRIETLCPAVFGSRDEMQGYYRQLLSYLQSFSQRDLRLNRLELPTSACEPPFNLQFHETDVRPVKEAYAKIFQGCFPAETPAAREGLPRIGLVVTGGHEGVFLKSMRGVLEHINPELFELLVFCPASGAKTIRTKIRNQAIRIVSMPIPFDGIVHAIQDAECDLIYYWEVGTDAINYFLPFFRLAPVQCTSWAVQVTSGIARINYYLSSELVEPADANNHYTETLLLAKTLLTYQYRTVVPESPRKKEDFGFTTNQHLYVCPQHLGKFHPDFDAFIAAILRRDNMGVMVITEDRYGHAAKQLRSRFARTMPDVADRIVFLPRQSRPDYLSLIAAADVLLDPPYFGGVNTTYDGFSLGKPTVTMPSRFHRGRYTYGCYRKMEFFDCVASSLDEYVDIAVRLGSDADYRKGVSEQIRAASFVLFEDIEAVREHERIFQELVEEARFRPIV